METPQHTETGAAGTADPRTPAQLFEAAAALALDPALSPVERAARITALLKAVDDRQKELTETRRTDVRELRKTMTLAKVGDSIGLSVPRVDQIAKGK
ncbi:hypothetical protein [Streptomyces sp. NPDC006527]|jgi:DNA-directed RNA polymerase sigma subunit (sigma70/sigma32)|uniref:hypothetical protein n=1 Tax=Streptomyces sp. NPDC006527 TaxID=3364749 RepID=UPI00368FE540